MVGGAALSRKFTDNKISAEYDGPVFYAKDAMEGLALSNQLSNEEEKRKLVEEHAIKKASSELPPKPISNGGAAVAIKPVSTVSTDVRVYQPY
ncbi:hypothetical protein R0K20_17165, partial [Staphylococcus sp. SIMBA_130]